MTDDGTRPTLWELWQQAGGGTDRYDAGRYAALMREHGHVLKDDDPREKDQAGMEALALSQP